MMKIGHIDKITGKIIYAKQPLEYNNRLFFISEDNFKVALQCGEKEIVETPKPTEDGIYIIKWRETDTQIIREWFLDHDGIKRDLQNKYAENMQHAIRNKYSLSDEVKILREYLAYDDEKSKKAFEEYNDFIENTKIEKYKKIYGKEKEKDYRNRKRK